jgi:hypothetical protein
MELNNHEKKAIVKYITAIDNQHSPNEVIVNCRECLTNLSQKICLNELKLTSDSIEYGNPILYVENNFFGTWNSKTNRMAFTNDIYPKIYPQWQLIRKLRNADSYNTNSFGIASMAAQCKLAIEIIMKWYLEIHSKYQLINITNLTSHEKASLEHLFTDKINSIEKEESQSIEQKQKDDSIPAEKKDELFKKDEKNEGIRGIAKHPFSRIVLKVFVWLILISVVISAILLIKSKNKNQKTEPQKPDTTKVPPVITDPTPDTPIITSPDTPIIKKDKNSKTENETAKPQIENETEVIKREEKELKPVDNHEQSGTSKYILNDEFKNKEGSTEMAVLIINSKNGTEGAIGQKVANVFLKNKGYNNTTSLLSQQFVSDGLFERIFNGGKTDLSKHKFSEYADYFCLGKLSIETEQSDVRTDMTKATINLEIKVIKTTNGGVIDHLTIPVLYSIGTGFSKQQAIEVATNNIITYLKNY